MARGTNTTALVAAALAVLVGVLAVVAGVGSAPVAGASPRSTPNIVMVMTDDQTVAQMKAVSIVNSRIGDRGATFENNFVNYPLCCPSRATFLTGQYAHNHGVLDNALPQGGYWRFHDAETLPLWLQRAGYYTAMDGKYLNGYGSDRPTYVPPGWTEWYAPIAPTVDDVYNWQDNENGTVVDYGDTTSDYKQDVITARALDIIGRQAPSPQPLFLYVAYTAPHIAGPYPSPQPPPECDGGAAKPAVAYGHAFDSEPLPQPPSFNEPDVSDKPPAVNERPPLTQGQIAQITTDWRCALDELLSVDSGVGQILDALSAAGELDNTYVFFTSDNGFFYGEHRIAQGKKEVYEENIRVPLLVRGPGIKPGIQVQDMAVNADLAPTILDLAGAKPGLREDGESLLPQLADPRLLTGRELSIESNRFHGIRTWRYVYSENADGSIEFYDLLRDPYELHNLQGDPKYRAALLALQEQLNHIRRCKGKECLVLPRVKLRLAYRAPRRGPENCAAPPVTAVIARKRELVDSVSFQVNGARPSERMHAPFRRRYRAGELRAGHNVKVLATVDLVDGRRITLSDEVRLCG